jgi:hypothetical protein
MAGGRFGDKRRMVPDDEKSPQLRLRHTGVCQPILADDQEQTFEQRPVGLPPFPKTPSWRCVKRRRWRQWQRAQIALRLIALGPFC